MNRSSIAGLNAGKTGKSSQDWVAKQIATGSNNSANDLQDVRFYGQCAARTGGAAPLVVHFHAGAFVAGSLETGACVPRMLAAAGAVVMSIEYPLAPTHPFPQAVEAGYAALLWAVKAKQRLAGKGAPVVVAGEEAGGNLAAAVALMARDQQGPKLAGQILLSPMLDPCMATDSLRCADAGPVGCTWADGWRQYLAHFGDESHPYAAPSKALRLAGLPPTLLLTALDDPLRDETLAYADRLRYFGRLVHAAVLLGLTGWPATYLQGTDKPVSWSAVVQNQFSGFFNELSNSALPDKSVHQPSFSASTSISIF